MRQPSSTSPAATERAARERPATCKGGSGKSGALAPRKPFKSDRALAPDGPREAMEDRASLYVLSFRATTNLGPMLELPQTNAMPSKAHMNLKLTGSALLTLVLKIGR